MPPRDSRSPWGCSPAPEMLIPPRDSHPAWGCSCPQGCSPPMGILIPPRDSRPLWGCSPPISRDAHWHPHQEGAPRPSSLAPLPPALLGCHIPAQGCWGGGVHPCEVHPAGEGWVPAVGRDSPYVPMGPRLCQEMGTAFPWDNREYNVGGVAQGRPGACAGSSPVGESWLGLEKHRGASLNPIKAKKRIAKREGCSGERCFLLGGGKEIILEAAAVAGAARWAPRCGRARVSRWGAGCCRDQHYQP